MKNLVKSNIIILILLINFTAEINQASAQTNLTPDVYAGYVEAFQPTMETDIVHGGRQSVPVSYDNTSASLSEVTVSTNDLAIGSDWTKGSPEQLTFWFNVLSQPQALIFSPQLILNGHDVIFQA